MGPSRQQGGGIGTLLPNQSSNGVSPSTTPQYLSGIESDDGYFEILMDDLYDKMKAGSQDSNVIVPETGAAKYWYVDPTAQGVPSPSSTNTFDPIGYADEQGHVEL